MGTIRSLWPSTLSKKNVEMIDGHTLQLRCETCGAIWSPNLRPGGRLPHGYWKCPNGCNAETAKLSNRAVTRERSVTTRLSCNETRNP
jgi:hypothetical protein